MRTSMNMYEGRRVDTVESTFEEDGEVDERQNERN